MANAGAVSDAVKSGQSAVKVSFNPFDEPHEDSDAILRVEGTDLHVHEMMLSRASPVFKAMLKGDFKEGKSKVIDLQTKKLKEVINFLCELYPDMESQMTGETVLGILSLAHEYQTMRVVEKCDLYLSQKETNTPCAIGDKINLLTYCQKYDLKWTTKACVRELWRVPISQLKGFKKFSGLEDSILKQIYERRLAEIEQNMDGLKHSYRHFIETFMPLMEFFASHYYSSLHGHIMCSSHENNQLKFKSDCPRCVKFLDIVYGVFQTSDVLKSFEHRYSDFTSRNVQEIVKKLRNLQAMGLI